MQKGEFFVDCFAFGVVASLNLFYGFMKQWSDSAWWVASIAKSLEKCSRCFFKILSISAKFVVSRDVTKDDTAYDPRWVCGVWRYV